MSDEASKYPVLYHSHSRNRDERIEDMHDMHLLNAFKKAEKELLLNIEDANADARTLAVRDALKEEVHARGLDKTREEPPPAEDEGDFGV